MQISQIAKEWKLTLMLVLISLIISLFAGEIITRIISPQYLVTDYNVFSNTPNIRKRHIANANIKLNTLEGPTHFVSDQHGYRINYLPHTADPKVAPDIAILNIGDSFIEGLQVENEQTISNLLRQSLSEKYDIEVRSVNDGVGGWRPDNYYLEAKYSLGLSKYDLGIIYLYLGNDVISQVDTMQQRPEGLRPGPQTGILNKGVNIFQHKVIGELKSFLESHSHLYMLARRHRLLLFSRANRLPGELPLAYLKSAQNTPQWETTTMICEMIAHVFAQHQTPVVFVLLPPCYQINPELIVGYLKFLRINAEGIDIDQPNQPLAETFAARSLKLLDPLSYMRHKAAQGTRLYGNLDSHFNAAGHQAVAEFLLPHLEGILKDKLATSMAQKKVGATRGDNR